MSLPSGIRLGGYEVLRALGAGGMGEVYLARDATLDRMAALKLLPADRTSDPHQLRPGAEQRLPTRATGPATCMSA